MYPNPGNKGLHDQLQTSIKNILEMHDVENSLFVHLAGEVAWELGITNC